MPANVVTSPGTALPPLTVDVVVVDVGGAVVEDVATVVVVPSAGMTATCFSPSSAISAATPRIAATAAATASTAPPARRVRRRRATPDVTLCHASASTSTSI